MTTAHIVILLQVIAMGTALTSLALAIRAKRLANKARAMTHEVLQRAHHDKLLSLMASSPEATATEMMAQIDHWPATSPSPQAR